MPSSLFIMCENNRPYFSQISYYLTQYNYENDENIHGMYTAVAWPCGAQSVKYNLHIC